MAVVASRHSMPVDNDKTLHPFFTGSLPPASSQLDTTDESRPEKAKKRGRPPKNRETETKAQTVIPHPSDCKAESKSLPQLDGGHETAQDLHPDPSPRSRKRRKNDDAQKLDQSVDGPVTATALLTNGAGVDIQTQDEGKGESLNVSPRLGSRKKTLRLNGKGGFGSPRKPKDNAEAEESGRSASKVRRSGRKGQKTAVVIIAYGSEDAERRQELGRKIDDILSQAQLPLNYQSDAKPAHTGPVNPSKPTHPFFSAGAPGRKPHDAHSKTKTEQAADTNDGAANKEPPRKSFTTPVKPIRTDLHPTVHAPVHESPIPVQSHNKSRGPPGAPLPWRGFRHLSPSSGHPRRFCYGDRRARKSKQHASDLGSSGLLSLAAEPKDLPTEAGAECLQHCPTRSLETESSLKQKLIRATRTLTRTDERPEGVPKMETHPALTHLHSIVGQHSHAFDRGECESKSWSQKYAPEMSAHVLQPVKEMRILRDWLSGLTVDAVEKQIVAKRASRASSPHPNAKRKKRRKRQADDLDGFLVSSDEEDDEMRTLPEDEIAGTLNAVDNKSSSVIRTGDVGIKDGDPRKVMNAVLLSGPSGCGKTAAAYAVAQELGFSVFELNPTSKRSGKDILDKVGDMSLNHQVKKNNLPIEDDATPLPQEPEAGQNTLASFFGAGSKKPGSAKTKPKVEAESKPKPSAKPSRPQKQSLILLEEVDVLFEDDKQFWETVVDLAKQSRRPIIMTCNDERTLPIDTLSLHAILRLGPPSADLAALSLSAMAAAEGHLVAPSDTHALYARSGHDLRASIASLNFWCQMTIGSDKGGLDWYLKRWPRGRDINSQGQKLHVVSNSTFQTDLCMPPRQQAGQPDDDYALQAWSHWNVEPTSLAEEALWNNKQEKDPLGESKDKHEKLRSLARLERCLEQLSAADTLKLTDSSDPKESAFDTSHPSLTAEARANFTSDSTVILDEPCHDYQALGALTCASLCTDVVRRASAMPEQSVSRPGDIEALVRKRCLKPKARQSKPNFITALDALIEDPINTFRPAASLSTEIGPYARSIVAYDLALEHHREALTSVFADGKAGKAAKQARKTRASRSALEGSQRSNTRRERWFDKSIDYGAVMATAGTAWPRPEADMIRLRQELDVDSQIGSDSESSRVMSQS